MAVTSSRNGYGRSIIQPSTFCHAWWRSRWRMMITGTTETWTEALGASRDRVLAAAGTGRHRAALLAHATAGRIVAAWTLDPAPRDPSTHLEATHARCRRHLERLLERPSGVEVCSPM